MAKNIYSRRTGTYVDPDSSNYIDQVYPNGLQHAYYAYSGMPTGQKLFEKTKGFFKGSKVPATYNPSVGNSNNSYTGINFDTLFSGNRGTAGSSLKGLYNKLGNNINWSSSSGINAFGRNIGGTFTKLGGLMQGAQALSKSSDLRKSYNSTEDLVNDILLSANSNPLANSYLTSDQRTLLSKAKRGGLKTEGSFGDYIPDDLSGWGDALKAAVIGYVTGGVPGAVVQGLGTAANSGLDSAAAEQAQQQAELEALLATLEDAELQYQSMKRPPLSGLGIQQRYQNMYM